MEIWAQMPFRIKGLKRFASNQIVPMFYKQPDCYTDIMRMSIALNGSFFNTQRMVQQYVTNAYVMRNDTVPSVPRTPVKSTVVEPSPAG